MSGIEYRLDDPFRLGYRILTSPGPNGEPAGEWVPLTADDILDPWPGYEACQDSQHSETLLTLYTGLDLFLEGKDVSIVSEMKMRWGIPGLLEPAPDIAILPGAESPHPERWYFDVAEAGALPHLIIEIVTALDPQAARTTMEESSIFTSVPEFRSTSSSSLPLAPKAVFG